MASGLLDKANIILTPTGYKAGTMYNVAPIEQPYEDFVFSRASVASRVNSSGLVEMVGRTLGSNLVQNGDFSELGPELVTNGTFDTDSDWTIPIGWSIANGVATVTNTINQQLRQPLTFANGKTYKISFEITEITQGSLRVYLRDGGNQGFVGGTYNTVGVKEFVVKATTTSDTLAIYPTSTTTASIDNISVKQVDPNDYWTFSGGNITINDEGCRINRITSTTFIQQNVLTSGKVYKVEFDVLDKPDNSGTFIVRLGSNNVYDVVTYEGTRFSKYITSAGIDFRIYSSSNNGVIYVDNIVVQEVIDTNNIPRINYDSNGENGHWLLEPTSTNLITYSEDFTDSSWVTASGSVIKSSNTTTSPSGLQDADTISATSSNSIVWKTYVPSITDYTGTVYLKRKTGSGDIQFTASGTFSNVDLSSGDWVRVEHTYSASAGTKAIGIKIIDSGDEVYIWGAQLEELPYATSYIPTLTGSQEVRATETATGAGSADLINSTEGVLYAEIAALADDISGFRVLGISDGGSTNRIFIGYTSNNIYANVGAGTTIGSPYTPTNASNFHKVALKYENNNCKFFVDGSQIGSTTTSITIPSGMNSLQFDSGAGGSDFYGKVKALAVFNTALTDAELTELTS